MLKQYRNEIDKIDKELISLLNERFKITKLVGEYKRDNNIEILNQNREVEIFNKIQNLEVEYTEQIVEVYVQILKTSKKQQYE